MPFLRVVNLGTNPRKEDKTRKKSKGEKGCDSARREEREMIMKQIQKGRNTVGGKVWFCSLEWQEK